MPSVSLVMTVLNEAHSLPAVLDGIAAQTRVPEEVVICDGGSHDDSVALLRAERRFPVRVIEAPGANISRGRNVAIAAASGEIIACTDAGTRLAPDWLARITAPFERDARTQVSAGFFLPDYDNTFELAMSATVLPAREDIKPETFLPSSRSVAFRKTAWAQAGGYPEWLDYCEDLIFDLALREKTGPFAFAPDALVYFKPRGSLRSFFKQYYLYARGDGKSGLFLKRHVIRYGAYLAGLALLASAVALSWPWNALAMLLLIFGVMAYTKTPYRRLFGLQRPRSLPGTLYAVALVPVIRLVGDVAKMLGYPVGLLWRSQHRQRQTAQLEK